MARVELDRRSTVHEVSNQQSVKARSSPTQTWIALGKLVATYNFAASPFLHYMISFRTILDSAIRWLSQNCDSYRAAFASEMWAQMGQITNTAWKNTCGTVASLRVPRLGGLPSQAKLPLHDGRSRSWQTLHCSWNVTSTIRKTRACPTQTWIALGKLVATYNLAASPFLHCMISTRVPVPKLWFLQSSGPNNKHSLEEHMWHVASTTSTVQQWLVATYNFAASPFLHCMISTQVAVPKLWFLHSNGPNNKHSLEEHMWHVDSTTSTVQQWHPCKWQD